MCQNDTNYWKQSFLYVLELEEFMKLVRVLKTDKTAASL